MFDTSTSHTSTATSSLLFESLNLNPDNNNDNSMIPMGEEFFNESSNFGNYYNLEPAAATAAAATWNINMVNHEGMSCMAHAAAPVHLPPHSSTFSLSNYLPPLVVGMDEEISELGFDETTSFQRQEDDRLNYDQWVEPDQQCGDNSNFVFWESIDDRDEQGQFGTDQGGIIVNPQPAANSSSSAITVLPPPLSSFPSSL